MGAEARTATDGETKPEAAQRFLEAALERGNMLRAYQRVVENKGAPGVDGLTVSELKPWLQAHWPKIKQALLAGEYMPTAVRKVEIPKLQGGVRILGIPCVLDRLIQQALHQILQPLFDPGFSASSYGYRPGRNAHQRGGHRIRDEDRPKRTPQHTHQLLARAHKAGANIGVVCDAIHHRQAEAGVRRILGMLSLTKKYGSAACDQACAAALELGVSEYQFVRRYLERSPQAPLSLRQIDPLIRELTQYRDLIQQRIQFEEPHQ
jgi:hypothetical protein